MVVPSPLPPILILTGPTAVGKTELSLNLARQLSAEIVSADSRQIYRRLDVGTAKPTVDEREGIPHHFIDELDLTEPFSAGAFAAAATERMHSILALGKQVLVVGGSTLYLAALHEGLATIPTVAPEVRLRLMERLKEEGSDALYAELMRVDPEAAARLDPTKTQRLVRALEVFYGSGRPLSSYYEGQPLPEFDYRVVVLDRHRAALHRRINDRVDHMMRDGLLEEAEGLLRDGYDPSLNALQTIGYREAFQVLAGTLRADEAADRIKTSTRQYARRQLTWFRRYSSYTWLDADQDLPALMQAVLDAGSVPPKRGC